MNTMLSVLGFSMGELLLIPFILVCLAVTVFWVWMLVSAIQNKGLTDTEKIIWVLVIIFLHGLGAVLYFFLGHPKRLT